MTGYVQTRWYRAPEVMIDWKHYDRSGKFDLSLDSYFYRFGIANGCFRISPVSVLYSFVSFLFQLLFFLQMTVKRPFLKIIAIVQIEDTESNITTAGIFFCIDNSILYTLYETGFFRHCAIFLFHQKGGLFGILNILN